MIAHSEWKHGDVFEGVAENGNTILFDADAAHTHGPSPVVAILQKKRQDLTGLRVTATAERADSPPRVFTRILLTYAVRGKLSRKAVEDAVALSKNKYCSVSKMLEKAA